MGLRQKIIREVVDFKGLKLGFVASSSLASRWKFAKVEIKQMTNWACGRGRRVHHVAHVGLGFRI